MGIKLTSVAAPSDRRLGGNRVEAGTGRVRPAAFGASRRGHVDSFGKAADEVFSEVVAHSDLASRIHNSFLKAREEVGGWTNISDQAYVAQRNRVLGL